MSLILLFSFTLFTSAALLFWIQPLMAKMMLPYLGGAPAVWNVCMVFFQSTLLLGYLYVLALIKWFGFWTKAAIHFILLSAAVLFFPFSLTENLLVSLSAQQHPVLWGFAALIITVGFPFFVVSATNPLLQYWFSRSHHRSAKDPYFLFAASNLGSLIALLGFPLLLEPNLSLNSQSRLWALCYGIMAIMIAACFVASRRKDPAELPDGLPPVDAPPLTVRRRAMWVAAAFIPSSLMLSVTQYISTDIAAVPLLWVVPLALYLISFVLVFIGKRLTSHGGTGILLPGTALLITFIYLSGAREPGWFLIPINLAFLFMGSMICHGRLAADRPHPHHLVHYYILIALGGMGGGIFNTLAAPFLFDAVVEYPLAIVLTCLMLPVSASAGNQPRRRFTPLVPFGILLLTALLSLAVPLFDLTEIEKVAAAFGIPIFLVYLMRNNPFRFGLSVGAIMLGGMFLNMSGENILHRERNFFGVLKVAENRDGDLRIFYHGNTVHGKQHLDPERRCVPLAYFHPAGPLGDIFEAYHSRSLSGRVSGIGLGVGAINAYSRPGEEWTFYEIDPAVADIAEDERWFTYLSACAATPPKIVLGDARLRIEETLDETYGLIVLDAFSSDAIPVHLITEEAVDLYFSKLAPGGMMAFHISNRNLDLRPVLAGAAKRLNLKGVFREDREQDEQIGKFPSTWAVLARTADDLGPLADNPGWIDVESIADPVFWSDDFSNILSVLKWFR